MVYPFALGQGGQVNQVWPAMVDAVSILAALIVSLWLTGRFTDPHSRLHLIDQPNHRSLHEQPTPRSGGIAILAGLAVASTMGAKAWQLPIEFGWVAAGVLGLATVSFLDDLRGVRPAYRLAVHFAAAALLPVAGYGLRVLVLPGVELHLPLWLGVAVSLLFTVWMVDLYNFMDGMDGFAGGMAVFGFGTYAVLGYLAGESAFGWAALAVVAAALGFLAFNFPPARIFMGDVGSAVLGYLAAAFALWADRQGVAPLWVSVLVFSPFVVDATVTLLRRALRGDTVWEAHRSHYYQRLVTSGWGHRRTVLWEYALMAMCAAAGFAAVRMSAPGQWTILGSVAAVLIVAMVWVDRRAPFP